MFKICKNCDFEWHSKDGMDCPACSADNDKKETFHFVFNANKKWVQSLALVLLVALLVLWVLR